MPMDGVMLGFVARELNEKLRDGRIDRVIQPERDEIHLLIRAQGENHRLVLSAAPSAPRVHLTRHAKTGPMEPPMLCMLLRKHLGGGRIAAVRRIAGDRILEIDVTALSELGDVVLRTLVVEIMGRHSNIILRDENGRILDAARHVGEDISRVRLVQPGLPYAYPPSQGKLDPDLADAPALEAALAAAGGKLAKAIGASIAGFSPQAAREAAARIGLDGDALVAVPILPVPGFETAADNRHLTFCKPLGNELAALAPCDAVKEIGLAFAVFLAVTINCKCETGNRRVALRVPQFRVTGQSTHYDDLVKHGAFPPSW